MPFISYTRNFEDVILNRVFKSIPHGFFVDVGAFHPVSDSNTYALYKRGWRGVNIDPAPYQAALWPQYRPEDTFIKAAAGAANGLSNFYMVEGVQQFATTTQATAQTHQSRGKKIRSTLVPMVTLDSVLAKYRPTGDIHCISIDVEGGERAVLEGLDLARFRPWLVMLESVEPGMPVQNHAAWESLLLTRGYESVYFDAVNRFYLANERAELKRHFTYPPCVWDDFVSQELLAARHELASASNELAAARAQVLALREQLEALKKP